jgi:hypothetical protein
MLIPIVERFQKEGERETDQYAAWLGAIRRLQSDFQSGSPPPISGLRDYLQYIPEDQQSDALQDLIAEHLHLSWKTGKALLLDTCLDEFKETFPQWCSHQSVPADLIEDEFLARYQSPLGDTPSLEEYQNRFPGRTDLISALSRRCLDGERFVKLHCCGLGAIGAVWAAFDHQEHRPVAIKEPRVNLIENDIALRQFDNEATITRPLDHPGIVSLRKHSPADGTPPIYLMRLVTGPSLSDRIREFHHPAVDRSRREERRLRNGLLQSFVVICHAIAYAHDHEILHRDLKPGNVVFDERDQPVILDWGMAASTTSPPSNTMAGTPNYMPPEQADGFADTRSDVFGLGAILYEILTGRPPHSWPDQSRPAHWLDLVRQAEFPRPRRLRSRTPRALDAICYKALAPRPAHRHPSARTLAEEVLAFLNRKPFWQRVSLRLR